MEVVPKRKNTRLQGYDYSTPGAYFLTLCTENRRCILSRIVGTGVLDGPHVEMLPYGQVAEKYLHQLNDFYDDISVDAYVIMPNHIHVLLVVKVPESLETAVPTIGKKKWGPSGRPVPTAQNSRVSRFISTFKRFCNKECGENIWQYRSYDHIIRNQEDYDEHLKYILENPIRWQLDKLYSEE